MAKRKTYEVGYGKPPVHSRFKPLVSGNPSGGKKGRRSLKTDFEAELLEVVTVTENGKVLKLSKQQLVVKALTAKAAKGDTAAIGKVIELIRDLFGLGVEPGVDLDQISADDEEVILAYMARNLPDKRGGDDD